MKLKFILGCAIAVYGLLLPVASAQDYCCPQYDQCCCEMDFDGFYIGGNLGVVTLLSHRNDLDGHLTDNSGWTLSDTDVTAGVQLGYDWLCCNRLLGLVVDWNWTNIDRKLEDDPNNSGNERFVKSEFDWFTTIRARAGVAVCDTLFYLTAGAAAGRFETTWKDGPNEFCHDTTRWGWTGGVGTEFQLCCNFSLGAEVLFLHFDNHNKSFTDDTGTTFTFGHSDSSWVGRIVLNYRFGDLCCW